MILMDSPDAMACDARESKKTKNHLKQRSVAIRKLSFVVEIITDSILTKPRVNSSFFDCSFFQVSSMHLIMHPKLTAAWMMWPELAGLRIFPQRGHRSIFKRALNQKRLQPSTCNIPIYNKKHSFTLELEIQKIETRLSCFVLR